MVTHLQLVNTADIARFAELDVIAVPQVYWDIIDMYYYQAVEYVGQERAAQALSRAAARCTRSGDALSAAIFCNSLMASFLIVFLLIPYSLQITELKCSARSGISSSRSFSVGT